MVFDIYFADYLKEFNSMKLERWNYHWGCVLLGAQYLYEVTHRSIYLESILHFGNRYVDEDGTIIGFDPNEHNVDLMASGRLLYFLYDYTKEEKYLKGIRTIRQALDNQPRTSEGNFWHKQIYPYQVWLDGLYMVQPFYMEYEKRFNHKKNYEDSIRQFKNVRRHLYDEKKKLYYHAYDEKKEMIWADKETGLSPSFWLRSMGWYLLALCDCYEISDQFEAHVVLGSLLKEAIDGLLNYQDPDSGLFYQLIDRSDLEGNYLETSGSAMVSYAILKGCRLGILDREIYQEKGARILAALEITKTSLQDGSIHLTGTCASAGLGPKDERDGSPEYYLSEAVKDDNAHGVSMCMMTYSEWLRKEGTYDKA